MAFSATVNNVSKINHVIKRYNAFNYYAELKSYLEILFPNEDIAKFSKHDMHKLINKIFITSYYGERIIKYLVCQDFIFNPNIICGFEMPVKSSRIDCVTIDATITSYEIKSRHDKLDRLPGQINNYLKAFEFNYVVIDEKHFKNIFDYLPSTFGIIVYCGKSLHVHKKASKNLNTNIEFQLGLLSESETRSFFRAKDCSIESILISHDLDELELIFKHAIKQRYCGKWTFLEHHKQSILPIDYLFFYNNNIEPEYIYTHQILSI